MDWSYVSDKKSQSHLSIALSPENTVPRDGDGGMLRQASVVMKMDVGPEMLCIQWNVSRSSKIIAVEMSSYVYEERGDRVIR